MISKLSKGFSMNSVDIHGVYVQLETAVRGQRVHVFR